MTENKDRSVDFEAIAETEVLLSALQEQGLLLSPPEILEGLNAKNSTPRPLISGRDVCFREKHSRPPRAILIPRGGNRKMF